MLIPFKKMSIKENISLKSLNTFSIDVYAKYFTEFNSTEELIEILQTTIAKQNAKLILGGGSNVLFTKNVDALILKNNIDGIEITNEDENHVYLKAGAGVEWHRFVLHCLDSNLAGVENLALIPGSVGASPMQNIGAYGVEIKDVFYSLEAIHLKELEKVVFHHDQCEFGYRESVFKNKYSNEFAITSVTYKLKKKSDFNTSYGAIEQELQNLKIVDLTIQNIAQAVINIRRSKLPDPALIGNAGSFFKNPEIPAEQFSELKKKYPDLVGYKISEQIVKIAAGWLIEKCGWKGFRSGDAGVHDKQALVLVNFGKAHGAEILNLSENIIISVQENFGVTLTREVNIY